MKKHNIYILSVLHLLILIGDIEPAFSADNSSDTWATAPKQPIVTPPEQPHQNTQSTAGTQSLPGWAAVNPATGKPDQVYVPFATPQPEPGNVNPSSSPSVEFKNNSIEVKK